MASRKEEKERLRQERLAAEAKEKRRVPGGSGGGRSGGGGSRPGGGGSSSGGMGRLWGVILGVAFLAAIGFAIYQLVKEEGPPDGGPPVVGTLEEAAEAADCELRLDLADEGAEHENREDFKPSDYDTNPPTSGNHFPQWYQDGIYEPGSTGNLGQVVHALEHGRIELQYKKGTPKADVEKLHEMFNEIDGYHTLVLENTTNMPFKVAATTWRNMIGCNDFSPETMNALRAFRRDTIDRGPEVVP